MTTRQRAMRARQRWGKSGCLGEFTPLVRVGCYIEEFFGYSKRFAKQKDWHAEVARLMREVIEEDRKEAG